jgi:hypothetical protein
VRATDQHAPSQSDLPTSGPPFEWPQLPSPIVPTPSVDTPPLTRSAPPPSYLLTFLPSYLLTFLTSYLLTFLPSYRYVLEHDPECLPAFAKLDPSQQRPIKFTQAKLNFNHGWLVQAEAPPGALFCSFKKHATP